MTLDNELTETEGRLKRIRERKSHQVNVSQQEPASTRQDVASVFSYKDPAIAAEDKQALATLTGLIQTSMNLSAAIWVLETGRKNLCLAASGGLAMAGQAEASISIGDGSIISRAVETGTLQTVHNIDIGDYPRYQDYAQNAGPVCVRAVPVRLGAQVCGVIEAVTLHYRQLGTTDIDALHRFAEATSHIIRQIYRSIETQRIADIVSSISSIPDADKALRMLAEGARLITGAEASAFFILDRRSNKFDVVAAIHVSRKLVAEFLSPESVITSQICSLGEPVKIDDARQDPRILSDAVKSGARSIIGVPVRMEAGQSGVLYAYSRVPSKFVAGDVVLLQRLADEASRALRWTRLLLKPSAEVEQAFSSLSDLEGVVKEVCDDIKQQLGFDFVTIQLIRPTDHTIETIYGTGTAKRWGGLAWKHYLSKDESLRDIQADIVLNRQTEIIGGWDDRFDRWIYESFNHEELVRIFTPIVLVRDPCEGIIEDWYKRCKWETLATPEPKEGWRIALKMELPEREAQGIRVIGSIEAGYKDPQRRISVKDAKALARLLSQHAIRIYRARLPYLLETIAESALQIAGANSASVHFQYSPYQRGYVYEGIRCQTNSDLENVVQLNRRRTIARMSKDGRPRIITNLPEGDIKAVAALPLAAFGYSGAICLYFNNNNVFSENKISWLQLFLNTSARAIEHYIIYRQVREKARQQVSLHSVVQSLISKPEDKNLLRHIAWNTLNMLGADVVTIYEYLGAEKRFLIPPKIAGRLLAEGPMGSEVYEEDAPALLVNKGYSIYSARPVKSRIFNKAARSGARDETHPFVVRERIKSSAGILLKVSNEIVGVMFINFRRAHVFSQEEKQIIDTLTSAAAIAIKNRRLIETMGEDLGKDLGASVREIITTLDLEQVLNLIVKRAVVITGADLGVISRLDPVQQVLNLAARYPPDEPVILSWTKIRMGEGITGWVALNKESMIVNDLRANDHHRPFFASDGSALCVPLQDRDGRILGVIGVKSHALSAFNRKYQRILETLANYAVIAINNAESQRQLIATETIATLGDLAGPLVHWMKNQVGSIRTYAHRIQHLEGVDDDARRISARIYSVTQRILQETKQMKSWRLSTPYLTNVNLHSLMQRIWSHVQLPAEVRVNITLPVDMPKVRGGEVQLFNVFINLIQNSLDAMQTGGELFISGESIRLDDGLWAIIKVRDTGIGITKSSLERIFDAGFSTKGGISSGLGLWWTRTYIDRLGGRIAVNSKRGKGTEFIVTLPARELE